MTITELVRKLQTPGHGSAYQDEKLVRDFTYDLFDKVVKASGITNQQLLNKLQKEFERQCK